MQDVEDSDNESISHMSRISSIEDTSLLIKTNDTNENEEIKDSLYFDTKENTNDVNEEEEEEEGETIEIISNIVNNENEHEKKDNNDNEITFITNNKLINDDLKNDEKMESTNNNNDNNNNNEYLTKEEIIRKVSNPSKKESKRKKFNTVGPKSSIRFMLDNENESNLKNAMSTTNLNGNNDPSEFLNKKLEDHKNDISRKSLSRNFSRMIKNNKNNVFESNMAFVNKTFDEFNNSSENMDDDRNDKYSNSNFSIFYDKIKNPNQSSNVLNDDDINSNDNKSEEIMDSNEFEDQNNSDSDNEIVEKVFIPLKGMEDQNNSDSNSELGRISLKNKEEVYDQNNEEIVNTFENNDSFDSTTEINKHEKEKSTDTTIDESIYDNIKEYKPTHERKGSFSDGNKKKLSRKHSKRVPKCISKSSAAAFSMIQFNLENIDVDNVNDSDLDNLDFTKIKTLQHENSNISDQNQDQSQDQNQNQNQDQDQNQNQDQNQKSILDKMKSEYLSCEDVINDEKIPPTPDQNSNHNSGQKFEVIEENSQSNLVLNENNSSSQQSIPKSPAKPAPPPPSYTKVKTRTRPVVEESITDIFENVEGNKTANEENKEILISEEIKNRLESKRKKDHRPDDINKMSYKEILKEKKAIKQELLLLKSVYSHHSKNNSTSKNNNDFVSKSMLQTIESSMDANNTNSKMDVNSQLPPLHYDNNSDNRIITKKLQKEDIKYMKELYQKYAEIKFIIAKQNMETDEQEDSPIA